jgi:hypothetical protein
MLQHCLQVTIDPVNKEARTTDFLATTGLARPWQWVVRLPFASMLMTGAFAGIA